MNNPLFALEPHHAEVERAIQETRQAIEEALRFIDQQEDGPATMRAALKAIDEKLSAIETEVSIMKSSAELHHTVTNMLMQQRDEAIRQRDVLIKYVGRR